MKCYFLMPADKIKASKYLCIKRLKEIYHQSNFNLLHFLT